MRTEDEMYRLILDIAKKDNRIKAVYMNGSRTNKNAPKDMLQDYDIVYVVENTRSFIEDKAWIQRFGEILYMQYPDENPYYDARDKEHSYGWLMQFTDGTRIDLTVQSAAYALQHIKDDRLCRILLDKEHLLPEIGEANDCQYWVQMPTKEQYLAACNEFWWCTNNIAKGLWREEIPYVQDMASLVRNQLIRMLDWKVGICTGWSVSTGKSSKYLYRWLSSEEWQMFLSTYFDGNAANAWASVFRMCQLFEQAAQYVGGKLGWEYNEKEGKAAQAFLTYVHQLPKPFDIFGD